jgi:hypothetical protein
MVERAEKPLFAANASRSSAYSPMATATRGDVEDAVEMMPKGMFAREKCDPLGMVNQDRNEAIVVIKYSLLQMADRSNTPRANWSYPDMYLKTQKSIFDATLVTVDVTVTEKT